MDQEYDRPPDEGLPLGILEGLPYLKTLFQEMNRLHELEALPDLNYMVVFDFKNKEIAWIRREKGSPAFYSDIWDEDIANMQMRGLHALLQEKSLPDNLRDKIKGELAVRRIAKFKGKVVATSSYGTGKSSTKTSSPLTADHSKCADTSANASRRSLNDHTEGTTVSTGRGSPESTVQHYPLPHPPLAASRNEQAHLQEANAKCCDNHNVGRASKTVFSSEPTAHYQQSAAYAPTGADIEAGAFTTYSEPPPETIAMLKEPLAMIMIAGAFTLLSCNPETFRGPVERVLLGVMTVGFICSFMWLLMGGRRRRGRLSSFLQWAGVWAMFVAFCLIMAILITR